MAPKVERIVELGNLELGEGPHWDGEKQCLYLTDIFGKSIHKYDPSTKKHTQALIGKHVSFIIPVEGLENKFVISIERDISVITWDGVSDKVSGIQKIAEIDQGTDNRINDGKCDPSGRLWTGSMGGEPENGHVKLNKGVLISLQNKVPVTHATKVGISNGLAWNTALNKMYYVDSHKGTVDQFDFDIESGTIANRTAIFTLSKHDISGFPDGMAIDTDGNLWVAIFNGYRVIKIDPRCPETLLDTIPIPAKQTTSVAFGGPNLDELYVTSASFTIDGEELPPPDHGATFRVTGVNARGFPGVSFVL